MEFQFYVREYYADDPGSNTVGKITGKELLKKYPWLAGAVADLDDNSFFTMRFTIDLLSVEIFLI